jgi:YD repeat-containing protein
MNNIRITHILLSVAIITVYMLLSNVRACAGGIAFSYDSLNRLTNVDYGNGSVIRYTYDSAGNRITYSAAVSGDITPPTIAITSPTSGPGYTNSTATINLSGTASDNVGVTLVAWQNYSGGLGVATGTNSWSINGIPLKAGANVISVTAYDAAGNSTPATLTVTFAPGTGGTATTNTVFSDNFTGNTIAPTKWTFYGNTVFQTNGIMELLTTVTDEGPALTSLPIRINPTGKITITRQLLVHYGNDYFDGQFGIQVGSLPGFSVWYANIIYSDGVNYMPRYGFFLARDNSRPDVMADQANVSSAITPLWDTWFAEKTTYDPTSGIMEYFINNVSQGTYNVGVMPPTNSPTMTLVFTTWGWYTGHEQLFSNLVVSQVIPATTSAPFNQIAGYSRLANGVFRLTMNGTVGSNYVIYASSDLKYWTPLYTNTVPPAGLITFVDPSATGYPQRFYRAVPLGTAVTVQPPPPTPQLTGIGLTAGGQFQFSLNGPVGSNYVVQVSSNLVNWVNLETNAIPGGGVNVYDFPIQKSQSRIFYRALPSP